MTDAIDPRELLKSTLRELQELRRQRAAVERDKQERPAVIGAACRLPGANNLAALAGRSVATGSVLPQDATTFDHPFFRLDETETTLAPHVRLLLETGWEALEQAGRPPANLPADRVGVFVGIGGSELYHADQQRILPAVKSAQSLARSFGFRGPAVNIDAGDTSALVAIDLACRSLLAREIDLALAGGVALVEDAAGGGSGAGGCGLVVLKRLSDAAAERDNLLAVVHAHRAIFSAGDAAPPVDPLADLGRLFPGVADIDPQAIGYLGIGDRRLASGGAAVTNMVVERHSGDAGHLNGLAAFLNALLAVQTGINNKTAVAVAAGRDGWAGIAIQSAPNLVADGAPGPFLLLLSAHDGPALAASAGGLASRLREQPTADLARIGFTLRAGRTHFPHRQYLVVEHREQAIAALEKQPGAQALCERVGPPPIFLFPGLGSHYFNMARGLYHAESLFQEVVDDCARLLQPHLGIDIRPLFLSSGGNSPSRPNSAAQLDLRKMLRRQHGSSDPFAAQLDQTIHAQPALFVVEYALARLLAAWGLQPAAMLGYSLGEYVAACLAGVLSLEDALFLVATRARLIQALPPGKMIAVPLSESELDPLLGSGLAVSAVVGHSLCVVAGEPLPVEALAARLAEAAIAAQVLPTTHAFHTAMLRPIAGPFKEALGRVGLHPPTVPYVSNLTGGWITAAEATSPDYWLEHSCRPVRFAAGVETLQRAGYDLIVEVGPSQALSSLVTAIAREIGAAAMRSVPTMRYDYDPQPDAVCLQKAIGELWLAGVNVDWESFHPARRVSLPTYPFQRRSVAAQTEPALTPPVERQGDSPAALPLEPLAPAGTPTEQALAALWRDLLKLPAVDRRRTFFEHGGNSLLAAQLIFRIRKAFGVTLPLRAIFEAPGLAAMARRIDGHSGEVTPSPSENGGAAHSPIIADGLPITLPNGLAILCQNRPEVDHFYQDIFVDRVYVSHGVRLPAGAVVFDVGANIGLFSLFAHLEAPGARLYSFEPAPPLFHLLQANLERHRVAATVYPCALSSRPGTAELTFYPKSTGMSSLYADLDDEKAVLETVLRNQVRRGESELEPLLAHAGDYLAERFKEEYFTCRLRTLSEVMAEAGVDRIDLLKIDVQKAELDVLLGLGDRDWPMVRQIVVEVHDLDGRLDQMRRMLAERGFHVESDQEALYAGSPIYLLYGTRDNDA